MVSEIDSQKEHLKPLNAMSFFQLNFNFLKIKNVNNFSLQFLLEQNLNPL